MKKTCDHLFWYKLYGQFIRVGGHCGNAGVCFGEMTVKCFEKVVC